MTRLFSCIAALMIPLGNSAQTNPPIPQPAPQPAQSTPPPAPDANTAPLSLAAAQATALQQVSAFQQAQIDEAIAAEDLRQAEAGLLPRARSAYTVTYNSPERPPGDPAVQSFVAANGIHEYQEL